MNDNQTNATGHTGEDGWIDISWMQPDRDIPEAGHIPRECCGLVLMHPDMYRHAQACVRALAGIPDPAAFVARVRDAVESGAIDEIYLSLIRDAMNGGSKP